MNVPLPMDTILVVDSRANRRSLKHLLVGAGYQVEFVPVNTAAVSIVRRDRPAAVLLTWYLGKTLPQAACMAVRKAWQDVPLIVLGPQTPTMAKIRLFELGADDYVEEPFDATEFLTRIRSAIRRSRLTSKVSS